MGLVEWLLKFVVTGECRAFGGIVYQVDVRKPDEVRLCNKPRWHTDSHTYTPRRADRMS